MATVTVSWTTTDLANKQDAEAKIPYEIQKDGIKISTVTLSDTSRDSGLMKINVTTANWDAARAGSYEATVTFNLVYTSNY